VLFQPTVDLVEPRRVKWETFLTIDVVTDVLDTCSGWRCCSRLRGVSITADNSLNIVDRPKKRRK
jgi:hypothetical protein